MKNKISGIQLSALISLLCVQTVSAQNTEAGMSVSDKLSYSILIALGVVFIIVAAYVLTYASKALRENGGSLDLNFPVVRKMAFNGKTVGIIFLIIIFLAVLWALNFS